jgi:hypothetical protein
MWLFPRKEAETYALVINDTNVKKYEDIRERNFSPKNMIIGTLKRGEKVKLIDWNYQQAGIMLNDGTLGLVNSSDIEVKEEGPVYIDFSDSGSIKEVMFLIILVAVYIFLGRIKKKKVATEKNKDRINLCWRVICLYRLRVRTPTFTGTRSIM